MLLFGNDDVIGPDCWRRTDTARFREEAAAREKRRRAQAGMSDYELYLQRHGGSYGGGSDGLGGLDEYVGWWWWWWGGGGGGGKTHRQLRLADSRHFCLTASHTHPFA